MPPDWPGSAGGHGGLAGAERGREAPAELHGENATAEDLLTSGKYALVAMFECR